MRRAGLPPDLTPRRATEPHDWAALIAMIQAAFAGMEGRIDPPSSAHRLTVAALRRQAEDGEVWVIGEPPLACLFLTPRPGRLDIGKLAVQADARRRGLGRRLVELAETRARALRLPAIGLQTRVELTGNHATFRALGFAEVARVAHPGYTRPTSIAFRKELASVTLSGHCLCGAVRFVAKGPPIWVLHCHCESCRRATASPMTTFFAVSNADLSWSGRRASFASSPGVTRAFCPACGSPLSYARDAQPDETHIFAALLDDPASVTPEGHDFLDERIEWMHPLPHPQPEATP